MILVSNLVDQQVLRGISLSVSAGEIVALVGSQGSGKTTLLRVLAGQHRHTGGSASIAGTNCDSPEVHRKAGFVGDAWGLYPRLSIRQNLLIFARLWQLPALRVDEVLRAVDLLPIQEHYVEKIRPGEALRTKLARALLHAPPVLLLDEPFADADRESASVIQFTIQEVAERGGAVLLATFGHNRVLEVATRVVYLEGGQVLSPAPSAASASGDAGERIPDAIRHIAARRGERLCLFAPSDIRYAYSQEKSVYIQVSDGVCAVNATLTELEDRLAGEGFFRCHRGFLVNVNWVREIASWTRDSFSLILKDGKEVPLSKHRAQELKRRLGA